MEVAVSHFLLTLNLRTRSPTVNLTLARAVKYGIPTLAIPAYQCFANCMGHITTRSNAAGT